MTQTPHPPPDGFAVANRGRGYSIYEMGFYCRLRSKLGDRPVQCCFTFPDFSETNSVHYLSGIGAAASATSFSKRGSPRSESQYGCNRSSPYVKKTPGNC